MFHDVLLETTPAERRRRKLTLAVTLLGEAFVIAVLVAIPLLYLDALPGLAIHEPTTPISLSRAPRIGGATAPQSGGTHTNSTAVTIVRALNLHPLLTYDHAVQAANVGGPDVGPYIGTGDGPELPFIPDGDYVPPPVLKQPPSAPRQISHFTEGMIVHRVDPVYPQPARIARIEGEVTLRATIGTSGQLEGLQVMSGHPLLINAAVAAVEQWRFKPYMLNGQPIEVQSQITVKFVLQR